MTERYQFPYEYWQVHSAVFFTLREEFSWEAISAGQLNIQVYDNHYDYFLDENNQPHGILWVDQTGLYPKVSKEKVAEWTEEYLRVINRRWDIFQRDYLHTSFIKKATKESLNNAAIGFNLNQTLILADLLWVRQDLIKNFNVFEEAIKNLYTLMLQVTGVNVVTLQDIQEFKDVIDECNIVTSVLDD
ncbi:hypothetical protein H6G76_20085 [Nostoc sp. FACHB-152]|uniref:hypothetical protein n=1 Tax=Nostoc sp. FACHB-152 TaxID=2692837 RepID=UPI001685B1A7|nr:hypothetical protein [Nostoc sp. FACHB-152]MBD2449418.1 hypothetical protein [Nostoc sp. FACHB-152]